MLLPVFDFIWNLLLSLFLPRATGLGPNLAALAGQAGLSGLDPAVHPLLGAPLQMPPGGQADSLGMAGHGGLVQQMQQLNGINGNHFKRNMSTPSNQATSSSGGSHQGEGRPDFQNSPNF